MQHVDLTEFTNSSGWHIIHDSETFMYRIKAANGVTKPGSWTNKRMAEKALFDYLDEAQKHNERIGAKPSRRNAKKHIPKPIESEKISAQKLELAV